MSSFAGITVTTSFAYHKRTQSTVLLKGARVDGRKDEEIDRRWKGKEGFRGSRALIWFWQVQKSSLKYFM